MGLSDELAELHRLFESGALTEAEYAAGKARLLGESGDAPTSAAGQLASNHVEHVDGAASPLILKGGVVFATITIVGAWGIGFPGSIIVALAVLTAFDFLYKLLHRPGIEQRP